MKKRLFIDSSPPRAFIHIDEQEASMIKPATKSIVTTESKSVKGQQPATGYISLVKNPVKLKINIGKFTRVLIVKFLISEWSKKSTKFEGKSGGRDVGKSDRPRRDDRRDRDDIVCYNCDRRGHFQRDCKQR